MECINYPKKGSIYLRMDFQECILRDFKNAYMKIFEFLNL